VSYIFILGRVIRFEQDINYDRERERERERERRRKEYILDTSVMKRSEKIVST